MYTLETLLEREGFSTRADYWMESSLRLGTLVTLADTDISFRVEENCLYINYYRRLDTAVGLKNPFAGMTILIDIIQRHQLPIQYIKGKPDALQDSRLSTDRLLKCYLRFGAVVDPNKPDWVIFDLKNFKRKTS